MKPLDNRAWLLVLPVFAVVLFSAVLPLMTVVNYSVQDIISPERRVFVGTEWFAAVMRDDELHSALLRQLAQAFWEIHTVAVPLLELPPAEDILDTVNAHQAMLTALEAGDAEAYRQAVHAHYLPLGRVLDAAAKAQGEAAATTAVETA